MNLLYKYLILIKGQTIIKKLLDYDKSHIINFFIILYAFLIPISKHGFRTVTIILLILWLLDSNIRNKVLYIFKNRIFIAIVIFIGYSFISLAWSSNVIIGLTFLSKYWYLSALLIFITNIQMKNISKIISAFLLGMLLSEILSYGIFFELWTLRHGTPSSPSPYMNHTFYGLFLAFTALILLNKVFFEEQVKDKILYSTFFLTLSANLFINAGRTGYLTFMVTIFILGLLNIKNKILALFSTLILITTLLFTAYQLSPVFKIRTQEAKNEIIKIYNSTDDQYNGSVGLRLGVILVGIEVYKDNPIFGTGAGSEMEALQEKVDTSFPEMKVVAELEHYHNNYISYLIQLGIIGLVLYLNIFYQIMKIKIKNKELSNLRYIFIISFSIASMVDFMFIGRFTLVLFTLFTGIFISASTTFKNQIKA